MSQFTRHTPATAPEGAAAVLARVQDRYGFVPNLAAHLAESPVSLSAVLGLQEAFERSSLTPPEQQLVLLTVSVTNECLYCTTVHTGLARKAGLDTAIVKATAEAKPLADRRLDALRDFTAALVDGKGWVDPERTQGFLDAGYTRAHVFEVVMGVALKTFTNYCNHLVGAQPNPEFVALAAGVGALAPTKDV